MKYADWVYEFGIIDRASKNGVSPAVQVIFEVPKKNKPFKRPSEAFSWWRRCKYPLSSKNAYIEYFKQTLDFEEWLALSDEELA